MASGYRRGARGGSGRGDWAGGVRGSAGAPPAGPGRISGERRPTAGVRRRRRRRRWTDGAVAGVVSHPIMRGIDTPLYQYNEVNIIIF